MAHLLMVEDLERRWTVAAMAGNEVPDIAELRFELAQWLVTDDSVPGRKLTKAERVLAEDRLALGLPAGR